MTGYGLAVFPQHAALLEASAISPEVARARGYVSADSKKQLERAGFKDYQQRVPGLMIPVRDVTGAIATWQYRPDKPRETKARKIVKYENPGGSRLMIDVPPMVRDRLADPSVPLWITEGSRKADAAVSAGAVCIGLAGVDAWRGTNGKGGKTALADWASIALNGRRVYIAFDSDSATKPEVAGALERFGRWLAGHGSVSADVRFAYLPHGGGGAKVGLDDYLAAGGTLDALVESSTPQLVTAVQAELTEPDVRTEPAAGVAEPGPDEYDSKGRLVVVSLDRNPVDVADKVAEHLLGCNTPPRLFRMGDAAAVVLRDDGALTPLDADGWLAYVSRRVTFIASRVCAPPAAVMRMLPPVIVPELPALDGVAATPYLDRDGNVVAAQGYNTDTRLVLHTGDFSIPDIPADPGAEDVSSAVKLLTEDWLGDFPFATPSDTANALAVLLTLTGRMFFSLAPLFVIDASTAGSGKGLLVSTISLIATGEPPQVMELPTEGEEQRKKITSALLAGRELVMWDESHVISGRTLAAILTADTYSDRLLGGNKMISVRNRFTQVALGNNVTVNGDMRRRVVPCRLVPDSPSPEARTNFRHADLAGWVREHRSELLAAVLTIWRNWVAKGRPQGTQGMGSFDRWARSVGGALAASGVTGFRENVGTWLGDNETDSGWTGHLAELHQRYGDQWFTVSEVASAVAARFVADPPVRPDPDKSLAQALPYAYRGHRDKWFGDSRRGWYRLMCTEGRSSASGGKKWTVQARPPSAPAEADDQPAAGGQSVTGQAISSSASSVSSGCSTEPQVKGPATDDPGLLTMNPSSVSSVGVQTGIAAGQHGLTDDTDDADHRKPGPERVVTAPVCGDCGESLDSNLHAANCLGDAS